jgi:hypothetical protein
MQPTFARMMLEIGQETGWLDARMLQQRISARTKRRAAQFMNFLSTDARRRQA